MSALQPHFRAAGPTDINALEHLENRVFDGDRLSRRSLAAYIRSPAVAMIVVELAGEFAGYALLAFRKGSPTARLYSIALRPEFSGRGLGEALMHQCEAAARAQECKRLELEVRPDNAAAIRLYARMGYHHFGDYEDFYEDGAEAFRFRKAL